MPLHDVSYQRFTGPRTPRLYRSFALARVSAGKLLSRRAFLLVLAVGWIPAIVRAVQIYVYRQFPQASEWFPVGPQLWQEFLAQQVRFLPVLLTSLYAGADAVASDFSSGAIVVYLSKPLSRLDYILGKTLPVVSAVAFVTLVPALALLALHLTLSNDWSLLADSPLLPMSIMAYSVWLTLHYSLAVVAISSLARSPRIAGASFVALVFGSEVVIHGALSRLSPRASASFLSFVSASIDSGHFFFGTAESGDTPLLSALAMALAMVVCLLVLHRRVGSAEELS